MTNTSWEFDKKYIRSEIVFFTRVVQTYRVRLLLYICAALRSLWNVKIRGIFVKLLFELIALHLACEATKLLIMNTMKLRMKWGILLATNNLT